MITENLLGIALDPLHEFSLILVTLIKWNPPFILVETEAQESK